MEFPKHKRIIDKELLKKKDGYCKYCGKWGYTENHHIKSKASGGNDEESNIIELCRECHTRVHAGNISREELYKMVEGR
jgi:5-methylcytosine-specific restriction endonuclease McrA